MRDVLVPSSVVNGLCRREEINYIYYVYIIPPSAATRGHVWGRYRGPR